MEFELKTLRAQLEERRQVVQERLDRIQHERRRAGGALDTDWEEQATERENDEVLDGLDASEREELASLNTTLARIQEGSYGLCERCDEPISAARLQVMPEALLCIECAAAEETKRT